MNTMTSITVRLEGLLGGDRVRTSESDLQNFAVSGRTPLAVLRPQSVDEVAESVRFAASEKLAVVCCGSRSKLEMGMPPERYDLALDMTGLHEIAHYDPADLTLSVDAGMSMGGLQKVLQEKGQFLPLAVPCMESCTVGGAVASGVDSALRQQYGTARDFLIGAEFVDGKGSLCKSGGRVVKNVTGYDLHKLLIGSFGTLATITRLNFRTFPLPELYRGHFATFAILKDAFAFRTSLLASGLPLASLECFSPEFSAQLPELDKGTRPSGPDSQSTNRWKVYSAFEGNEAVVRRIEQELHKRAAEAKAEFSEILNDALYEQLSEALRESFDWLQRAAPSVALLRIVLPSLTSADMTDLHNPLPSPAPRKILLLRPCGVVYLALAEEREETTGTETLVSTVRELFSWVNQRAGSVTLLHAPLRLKEKVNTWGPLRQDSALMQRVKRAFDPQNIFAPGRFVGGL